MASPDADKMIESWHRKTDAEKFATIGVKNLDNWIETIIRSSVPPQPVKAQEVIDRFYKDEKLLWSV
jgi:hypothetical protein